MSVLEIYQRSVLPLSPPERLQLATMILTDIAPAKSVDERDNWTEEDLLDFSRQSWNHILEAVDKEKS